MVFHLAYKSMLPALDAEFSGDHLVTFVLTSKLSQIYAPHFNVYVHLCVSEGLKFSIHSSLKRRVCSAGIVISVDDSDKLLLLSKLQLWVYSQTIFHFKSVWRYLT